MTTVKEVKQYVVDALESNGVIAKIRVRVG